MHIDEGYVSKQSRKEQKHLGHSRRMVCCHYLAVSSHSKSYSRPTTNLRVWSWAHLRASSAKVEEKRRREIIWIILRAGRAVTSKSVCRDCASETAWPLLSDTARCQMIRFQGVLGFRKMATSVETSFLVTRSFSPELTRKTKRPTRCEARLRMSLSDKSCLRSSQCDCDD
jgi:hypothetical protein